MVSGFPLIPPVESSKILILIFPSIGENTLVPKIPYLNSFLWWFAVEQLWHKHPPQSFDFMQSLQRRVADTNFD